MYNPPHISIDSFYGPFWTGRGWRCKLIQTRQHEQTGHSRAVNKPFPKLTKTFLQSAHCALKSELGIVTSVLYRMVEYREMVKETTLNLCGLTTFFLLLHKSILLSTCSANEDYLDKQMPSFRSILVYSFELSLQNHPNLKFPIGALL